MDDRSTTPATLADLDALEARLTTAFRDAVAAAEAARIADKSLLEWRLDALDGALRDAVQRFSETRKVTPAVG